MKALGPHLMRMRTCADLVAGASSNCTMDDCASKCQVYLRAFVDTDPSIKLEAAFAPLVNITTGDYNIGLFSIERPATGGERSGVRDAAPAGGSRGADVATASTAAGGAAMVHDAMMLQNHDASNWRWVTVVWAEGKCNMAGSQRVCVYTTQTQTQVAILV